MTEIEIPVAPSVNLTLIPRIVERACASFDLRLILKSTLAKYPGCIHWHYKKDSEHGTLEITWYPRKRRLWLKIARNRQGDWIEETTPRLKRSIQKEFQ